MTDTVKPTVIGTIPAILSALADPATLRVALISLAVVLALAVVTIGTVATTGGEINFGGAALVEELQLTRSELATLTEALQQARVEINWASTEISRLRDDLGGIEGRVTALENPPPQNTE